MSDANPAARATDDKPKVAMIGLGRMGSAIGLNLARAGFPLTVHNRTPAKAAPLAELGATVAASAADAAATADVVVSCLMDDASVLDVVGGDGGIAPAMKHGAVHISTTTISPRAAEAAAHIHQEAGSSFVSAPVVGRPDAAEAGSLLTIVAGDAASVAKAESVLSAYTASVLKVGESPGIANYVKLGINYFVISYIELTGQIYAYAEKSGAGVELMAELIPRLLENPALTNYAEMLAERRFEPVGFPIDGGLKDVGLMVDTAAGVGAPFEFAEIVLRKMTAASDRGLGDLDWSAIYEITRAEAGLEAK